MKPLYFDYNATTPVLPRVREALLPYLGEHFGNPSSGHRWGPPAKRAVRTAREQVAALINCDPGEIVFTSCATESINTVLKGMLPLGEPGRLVTSAVEHPATLECAAWLERRGVAVTRVGVDARGLVSPREVAEACGDDTRLVSVMLANNETGALQPVAEIAAALGGRGVALHSDAAQAVGKVPVDVRELGVDFLTIAGHKIYAPKGIGALYVRSGRELPPLLLGGGQEAGRRSGTENVAYMAALGEACALAAEDLSLEMARQRDLGKLFIKGLGDMGADFHLHSAEAPRLPGTMFVGFRGLDAGAIISGLVGRDVAVSAGAACHDDTAELSHVLTAMDAPADCAPGTIRFSWGRPTTRADMEELLSRLGEVLEELAG